MQDKIFSHQKSGQVDLHNTLEQYNSAIDHCRDIFLNKIRDYGTSWRVLRPVSIVDQLYIKVQRIRTIQQLGTQQVDEHVGDEFAGIVNYGIIALIQSALKEDARIELDIKEAAGWYDKEIAAVKKLMTAKNHDYGEAWREMSQESFADLILVKLLRIRQILRNDGKTIVSEGIAANFQDIINYAVFALIQISEQQSR